MPTTLVHKKFLRQNDKLISLYHNSETPCSISVEERFVIKKIDFEKRTLSPDEEPIEPGFASVFYINFTDCLKNK